jgi:phage/conjugal plasmid C-4 type zinc finger TraR family protein
LDEIDAAQARDEFFRATALSKALNRRPEDDDPLIIDGIRCCLDCEEPIPLARLKANPGAKRCTLCQSKKERRKDNV